MRTLAAALAAAALLTAGAAAADKAKPVDIKPIEAADTKPLDAKPADAKAADAKAAEAKTSPWNASCEQAEGGLRYCSLMNVMLDTEGGRIDYASLGITRTRYYDVVLLAVGEGFGQDGTVRIEVGDTSAVAESVKDGVAQFGADTSARLVDAMSKGGMAAAAYTRNDGRRVTIRYSLDGFPDLAAKARDGAI